MSNEIDPRIKQLEDRLTKVESTFTKDVSNLSERISTCADAIQVVAQTLPKTWDGIEKVQEDLDRAYKLLDLEDQRLVTLEKHDALHGEMLGHAKAMIDAHTGLIEDLLCDMMKMREAYYHVFPDRLPQDIRVFDQLDSLTSKPKPDAEPKKT